MDFRSELEEVDSVYGDGGGMRWTEVDGGGRPRDLSISHRCQQRSVVKKSASDWLLLSRNWM